MKLFFTLLLACLPSLGLGQTCNYPLVTFQSPVCNPLLQQSVSDIVADGSCNAAPSNGSVGPGPFYRATCDAATDLLFFLSAVCSDAGCNSCRDNNLYVDNNNANGWDVGSGDCNALNSFNSFRVTGTPTRAPSPAPTIPKPTFTPTISPTISPSTGAPTAPPSVAPSPLPTTATPTLAPTTASPTFGPTESPSSTPSDAPTNAPSVLPSVAPSAFPTTPAPTLAPTTALPTVSPTLAPTLAPTTASPTFSPIFSPAPTSGPSGAPVTAEPTASPNTSAPTSVPTENNMCFEIFKASCVSLMVNVPVSTSCDCYSFCGEAFDQCFASNVDGIQIGGAVIIGNSSDNIIDVVCEEVYVAGCTDEDRPTASPTRSPVDDPTASPVSPSTDGPSVAPTSGATAWVYGLWSAVVGLGLAAFMY